VAFAYPASISDSSSFRPQNPTVGFSLPQMAPVIFIKFYKKNIILYKLKNIILNYNHNIFLNYK